MTHQGDLFTRDAYGRAVAPRDRHVAKDERPRLSRQCMAILERLQRGPASNAELATYALKYTSRISDIRAAGYTVSVIEANTVTGYRLYRLDTSQRQA